MTVNALWILALGLGGAFFAGLLGARQRQAGLALTLAALAAMAAVSAGWVHHFATTDAAPVEFLTAGTPPPFAINLRMGPPEAALTLLIGLVGLFSAVHMRERLLARGPAAMAVLLVAVMALSGAVLTRDVFNLFVFLELIVLSTAGLVPLADDRRSLSAGF